MGLSSTFQQLVCSSKSLFSDTSTQDCRIVCSNFVGCEQQKFFLLLQKFISSSSKKSSPPPLKVHRLLLQNIISSSSNKSSPPPPKNHLLLLSPETLLLLFLLPPETLRFLLSPLLLLLLSSLGCNILGYCFQMEAVLQTFSFLRRLSCCSYVFSFCRAICCDCKFNVNDH